MQLGSPSSRHPALHDTEVGFPSPSRWVLPPTPLLHTIHPSIYRPPRSRFYAGKQPTPTNPNGGKLTPIFTFSNGTKLKHQVPSLLYLQIPSSKRRRCQVSHIIVPSFATTSAGISRPLDRNRNRNKNRKRKQEKGKRKQKREQEQKRPSSSLSLFVQILRRYASKLPI